MFDVFWMNVAAIFALANVAFVAVLIYAYAQSWRRFRSNFTTSLVVFAVFFLLQNLVIVVFWYYLYTLVSSAQPLVEAAAPYLTLVNATETVGLGSLTITTWK
ncbi:MAG TPA: hypothetical protein VGS04_00215 [Nitrososphaerales archaeon]|nr:hypothetical protein [Nitrososphaerales archaeon]